MLKDENLKTYIEIYSHLNDNQKKLLAKVSYSDLIKCYGKEKALELAISGFKIATAFHDGIFAEEHVLFSEVFKIYNCVEIERPLNQYDLAAIDKVINEENHDIGLMFLDLIMSIAEIDDDVETELLEFIEKYYDGFIKNSDLYQRIDEDKKRSEAEEFLQKAEKTAFGDKTQFMN